MITRILFAVKNPQSSRQPGFGKAISIAKRLGASLELFHAISAPVSLDLLPQMGTPLSQVRREALAVRGKQLEKIAAAARAHRVATHCSVEWDFPPHEAIVRRARKCGADLIMVESHVGRRLAAWLLHLTDWELLRESPVPVLVLKNTQPWSRRPIVLSAVDPAHAHAKPARLDSQILAQARLLAQKMGGSVHILHANFPALFGVMAMDPALDITTLSATYEQLKAADRKSFAAFAQRAGIPGRRRHLRSGDPVAVIPQTAKELAADVVVMGAVSRSGLKRVFIGNTAERVLGALPCDVLVVKPAHLEKRVPRKARGMRVVAPQTLFPFPG